MRLPARKSRLAIALLAAGGLSGCAAATRYAATARELSGTELGAHTGRFASAWRPLDPGYYTPVSAAERLRGRFFLDSCVNELAARFDRPPPRAIRAAQVEDCMLARGWRLVVDDVPARP